MHRPVLRFLVSLQARENLACAHLKFGKTTKAEYSVGDAASGYAIGAANGERNIRRRDDSPGDGFAVKQASIAGFGLERVSDGMAQVEYAPQSTFALVGGNYFSFQLHRL